MLLTTSGRPESLHSVSKTGLYSTQVDGTKYKELSEAEKQCTYGSQSARFHFAVGGKFYAMCIDRVLYAVLVCENCAYTDALWVNRPKKNCIVVHQN